MMAIYSYKVKDNLGRTSLGTIEANDLFQAVRKLQQLGFYIVDLKEKSKFQLNLFWQKPKLEEMALICKQLSNLLAAGVPLISGMQIIYDYQEGNQIKGLLKHLMNEIELGSSLSEACANYQTNIPLLMTSMVYAGEKGGFLTEALERLANNFTSEKEIKDKILTAVSYSAIVIVISIFFFFFLFMLIIPMFLEVYQDIGVNLTSTTEIFLGVGFLLTKHWSQIFLFMFVLFVILKSLVVTADGQRMKDQFLFKLPIIGALIKKALLSRFCREFAYLLLSGITIFEALEIIKESTNNFVLQDEIMRASNNLKLGISLSESFAQGNFMPQIIIQMIAVGEQSGNMDLLLLNTGEFFDQEVKHLIERLPKLIEPVILFLVGIVVCIIILGFFLPMINAMYQLEM